LCTPYRDKKVVKVNAGALPTATFDVPSVDVAGQTICPSHTIIIEDVVERSETT
jgi:hypothetical protein